MPAVACTGWVAQAWAKHRPELHLLTFFFLFWFCAPAHNCLLPLPPASACDRQTDFPWHDPPGHTAPLQPCNPESPHPNSEPRGKKARKLRCSSQSHQEQSRAIKGNQGHGPEPRHSVAASSHSASPFPTEEGTTWVDLYVLADTFRLLYSTDGGKSGLISLQIEVFSTVDLALVLPRAYPRTRPIITNHTSC